MAINGTNSVVLGLCSAYLRNPTRFDTSTDPNTWTWEPVLSTAEQATLADIMLMAGFGITSNITLAEFQAIKPDLVTARNFLGIATPTAAQSNAALKATIRVLGALLRQ